MAHSTMRLAAYAAVLATAALSAPAASAADAPTGTISVAKACYVNTATAAAKITVSGAGWQAGETIELTDKLGRISSTATAGSDGTFTATVPAPVVDSYTALQISDTIEAYYEGTPNLTVTPDSPTTTSNPFLTTNFTVMPTQNTRNPKQKTTFELSGFASNRTVYAHYLSKRGKLLSTVSFGRTTGACGLRRVSTYEYPGGHPKKGTYTIQFDDSPHFSPMTKPEYRFSFVVTA